MKAKLIQIGNSKGVRLPKSVIEQTGLGEEIELAVEGDTVLIRNVKRVRGDWALAFAKMAEQGDDKLLDRASTSDWDDSEWEW